MPYQFQKRKLLAPLDVCLAIISKDMKGRDWNVYARVTYILIYLLLALLKLDCLRVALFLSKGRPTV